MQAEHKQLWYWECQWLHNNQCRQCGIQPVNGGKVTDGQGNVIATFSRVKVSKHNMAQVRYDIDFTDKDGQHWHGTSIGHNTTAIRCHKKG